ncbi:hypothetical protein D3C81_2243300 [compost metagenome]
MGEYLFFESICAAKANKYGGRRLLKGIHQKPPALLYIPAVVAEGIFHPICKLIIGT